MSKHKHRHNHEEDRGNPFSNLNMLSILMLILGYFGNQEPMYGFDDELQNIKHSKVSKKDAEESRNPGYTGEVLSKNSNSQDKAGYNEEYNYGLEKCIAEDNGCGAVVESEVVPEYPSKLILPEGDCNQVTITVPVVLTQFEVEFACEAVINLEQPATDIKRIKKNVFLGQCRLLPKVKKLFIGGIIRKSIEYGTEENIRHMTLEVPFKCATEVEYFTPPVISPECEQFEIETLRPDNMGTDLSEKTYINRESFNENIYCKLVSSEIKELDILDEVEEEKEVPECERFFETLTEKMVVKLNIKLIQEQEIIIK